MDEGCVEIYSDDFGLYKLGTLLLFITALISFIMIHIVCPVSTHKRERISKCNRNNQYDIEDYDYDEGKKRDRYTSILKADPAIGQSKHGVLVQATSNNSILTRLNYNSQFSRQNGTGGSLDRFSVNPLDDNQNVRRSSASFQSFGLPTRPNSTLYNTSDRSPRLKRASSSQELRHTKQNIHPPPLCSYNSMPNVYGTMKTYYDGSFEEHDEGQMHCAIRFDRDRSLLFVAGLAIQTVLPAGVPGFIAELTIVPKRKEIVRSKIYLAHQRNVNMILDEHFILTCAEKDLENCSVVISVKPLLGNKVLYAETELRYLNLSRQHNDIYLGGLLKGIFVGPYNRTF